MTASAERSGQRALAAGFVDAILRAARDGVALLHDSEVVYSNEAWRKLTGSSRDSERALLEEVVEGRSLAARLAELARKQESSSIDVRLGEGTAHEVLAELTAVPIQYESKDCVLVMARDLTARRQLEAQVARNERLASLGMLVAGVAHEINNPLTYTLGNLESLAARHDANPAALASEEARDAIRDAIDGCQRIATIIRELRSFHRTDDQRVVALDPNQVVRDAVRIVAPKCATVARLETELDEVPLVFGVQTSLVQVLINLIVNALDAMPEREPGQNVVRISTGCRGRDIRIEVADNGRGMAPELLTRIFEPFYSQGKTSGTGLGLTISRNLVEQMNGWIDVDSRLGTGTRFIVHLQAARASLARTDEPPPLPAVSVEHLRILVVDDEPLVARSVARLLANAQEVVCVHSVVNALDLLGVRTDIDLVLSDWVMPDGGAPGLMRGMKTLGLATLPFVVMTGLGQLGPGDHPHGPCVAKPVSRTSLLEAIGQALAHAEQRQSMMVHLDPNESAAFRVGPDGLIRPGSVAQR